MLAMPNTGVKKTNGDDGDTFDNIMSEDNDTGQKDEAQPLVHGLTPEIPAFEQGDF